jgi:hypothetical protein
MKNFRLWQRLSWPLQRSWNILLVIASVLVIVIAVYRSVKGNNDFYIFYHAAQSLLQGIPLYQEQDINYVYPPFFASVLIPLTYFSPFVAHFIALCINVLLIVLILILGFRVLAVRLQLKFNLWQAAGACALALLLSQDLILREFKECQNDLLILAGFTLCLYWLDRKPLVAGAILGFIIDIKYQALLFIPFLLLRARWRAALGLVVGMIAGLLMPALLIGWNLNINYLGFALRGLVNIIEPTDTHTFAAHIPSIFWYGNVSICNGLARVFHIHGWPIEAALIIIVALAGVVFLWLWNQFQKSGIPFIWRPPHSLGDPQKEQTIINLEWAILLTCFLIFSPQCTRRHLILLLNVHLLAVVMLLFPRPGVKRWPVIVALLIAQLGQFRWGLVHGWPDGDTLGLPGWGFLIFLLLIVRANLAYYKNIYYADGRASQACDLKVSKCQVTGLAPKKVGIG